MRKARKSTELFNRFYKAVALILACAFIVIGAGMLIGIILPDSYLLTGSRRLLFGGFILIYGLVRFYMLVLRRKKDKDEAPLMENK